MHHRKDPAKSRNEPVTSYSPIAHSLLLSSMDPAVREQVKKRFDIGFVLAKEHIPFLKYPLLAGYRLVCKKELQTAHSQLDPCQ